jgi:hypothetical protein
MSIKKKSLVSNRTAVTKAIVATTGAKSTKIAGPTKAVATPWKPTPWKPTPWKPTPWKPTPFRP